MTTISDQELRTFFVAEPLPPTEPPVMVRSWSEGMEVLFWEIGLLRGESAIAQELRAKREPRVGELIPVGPLGTTLDGRQASLRVVLVRQLPAVAVYFDDQRVGPAVQIDREVPSRPAAARAMTLLAQIADDRVPITGEQAGEWRAQAADILAAQRHPLERLAAALRQAEAPHG